MIEFTGFIPVPAPNLTNEKFNIRAGVGGARAWDLLLADDPKPWLDTKRHREQHQNNNLDRAEYLLSFAQYYPYGPQYFIFGGFFKVSCKVSLVVPEIVGGPGYALTPMPQHSEYIKRLIIKLERPVGRDLYLRWYENLQDSKLNPTSYELAPDTKLGTFPGYQNVKLTHAELERIIADDVPSWKDALSSVKAVYVITDLSNRRLYVGSASGEANCLWQRWASYTHLQNLTGGNKELVQLQSQLGDEHIIANFQYSILEIFDPKTNASRILQRDSFWKLALDSRLHGMNRN